MTRSLFQMQNVTLHGGQAGAGRLRFQSGDLNILSGRTAVLGPSGAGKSSLLNLLAGFEEPATGTITRQWQTDGRLPLFWSPADGGLWPQVTIPDHLRLVLPDSVTDPDRHISEWLTRFDLQHLASSRIEQLSAGERSRLCVARALAADPQVLILDEPLVHVDPGRLRSYWSHIRNWSEARNASLIFSSHQPDIVLEQSGNVICIEEGKVIWAGETARLYDDPPTETAARLLGPVNWFTADEQTVWEGTSSTTTQSTTTESTTTELPPQGQGVRPERLKLITDEQSDSPVTLAEVQTWGPAASVTLQHESGQTRTFELQAPVQASIGSRVRLHIGLWWLVLLLSGCFGGTSDDPVFPVQRMEVWQIPNEGKQIPTPRGLWVARNGDLYVIDDAGRFLIYDRDRKLVRKTFMPEYSVGRPEGLVQMLDGRIAVADTHYHRVLLLNEDGSLHSMFGTKGHGPGQFIYPETVIQDPEGRLYVCEYGGNDRIQRFSADGDFQIQFGRFGTEPGELQRPTGLVWRDHKIYVCDAVNNRVQRFSEDGQFEAVLADAQSAGLYYPYDMAASPEGDLYLAEFGRGQVTRLSPEGKLLGHFGSAGREIGQFWTPWGIAVSADGRIFVADTGNRRLVELGL